MKLFQFIVSLLCLTLSACVPGLLSTSFANPVTLNDSFNNGNFDKNWSEECAFDYSCAVVANPKGAGKVMRFEWRPRDVDNTRPSLGAELALSKKSRFSRLSKQNEFWYGLDIYVPDDSFKDDSQQVIISQLHGVPDKTLGEPWRNPVTALFIEDGQVWFRCHYAPERVSSSESKITSINEPIGKLVTGEWLNYVLRVRYDYRGDSGIVQLWQNGKLVIDYQNIGCGYNDDYIPVLKIGMYYWSGASDYPSRVIYYDNVKMAGHGLTYDTFTQK